LIKTLRAQTENVQPLLNSYLALLQQLAEKGLVNLDPTMGRNFGIIDHRVVVIDVGNFAYLPEKADQNTAHFETKLRDWISLHLTFSK
jgi:hypothetical protein